MTEQLSVTTEQVDDIPVLIAAMEHLGVAELIDAHFIPHGNWRGLSPGQMLTGWLAHILSEGDHRLNQVEDWAAKRQEILRGCLDTEVRALDFTDDRLAIGLDMLSEEEAWVSFERALNQRTLRVYDLRPQRVRIDSSTASGYGQVTAEGMFQFGHSKDHRPDLAQVKVVLSTLDPLGMPVATQVVGGHQADDPLYIPAIDQVRAGVGQRGLLYVGDCKLMALETRAHVQAGGDDYLGPFSLTHIPQETLQAYLKPVWTGEQSLQAVYRRGAQGQEEQIAEGFERDETLTTQVGTQAVSWVERRLVVRSLAHAQAAQAALRRRLEKAQGEVAALNEHKQGKAHFTEVASLRQAAETIMKRYEVGGLVRLTYQEQTHARQVRQYGERPTETRLEREVGVTVQRDEPAIAQIMRGLGWRVYGTNCPQTELTLDQAILAYREEYLVERGFGRLKGKPLTLTPMYLADDLRATGLIRLLSVGLRVLTVFEFVVRRSLTAQGEKLTGLYAGNPRRATNRPTTEAMLRVFKGLFLNFITIGDQTYRHLTPLSQLQQQILDLLDLPVTIYTRLMVNSVNPP